MTPETEAELRRKLLITTDSYQWFKRTEVFALLDALDAERREVSLLKQHNEVLGRLRDAERRRVETLERALGHISRCEDNMGNHKLARTALERRDD